MPNVVRTGDVNVAGGAATLGALTVTCEGLPVMLPGRTVTPHLPYPFPNSQPHKDALTVGGSLTVTCEGFPVIHNLCIDSCGDKRLTGALTVTVGL